MVSVIIDNYNYGKYISQAIDSVLNQTYEDYEVIIVDDGSTDDSKDIILNYCSKYPSKITAIFKPNGGQASAFNAGYALAKGDIICFLDSDDYWYNNKLEIIIEFHQKYDFVGHNRTYSSNINSPFKKFIKFENKRKEFLKEYGLLYMYNIATSSMSFSRNLLNKILPMPEYEFRVCADEYVMFLGMYYSNVKYIDKNLAFYRIHEDNACFGKEGMTSKGIKDRNFNTIRRINQILVERNEVPIPYINNHLRKLVCENEEKFIIEDNKYVLYGTGDGARKLKDYIEFCGGSIAFYCDSNSNKWGNKIDNIDIISPSDLVTKRNEYFKVVIASTWIDEIKETLNNLGFLKDKDYIYSEIVLS